MASPLSRMGCPVGTEGPSGHVKGESPTLAPAPLIPTPYPRSTLVASPSRESDSRMVLQVEAISEMDCHSSSRVSLPASDMTVGSEAGLSQGSAGQAPSHSAPRPPHHPCSRLTFADRVPQRQGSWQKGGPQLGGRFVLVLKATGAAWPVLGGGSGYRWGMPIMTTVPTPACGAPEPCFCSPESGVSPYPHWVLPAWLWWRGGGLGWCWAGLGPHRTGSCEGRDGSALGAVPACGPCLQRPPGVQERGGRGVPAG